LNGRDLNKEVNPQDLKERGIKGKKVTTPSKKTRSLGNARRGRGGSLKSGSPIGGRVRGLSVYANT